MNMKEYESYSKEDTFEIAKNIGSSLEKGIVVCLDGDLGVGKTVFAKGFAKGLGIEEDITSPTFTIVQTYDLLDKKFHHFDVYRISDESELEEIGYEEYFFSEDICLVEWASLIKSLLPKNIIRIEIKKDLEKGLNFRKISICKEEE